MKTNVKLFVDKNGVSSWEKTNASNGETIHSVAISIEKEGDLDLETGFARADEKFNYFIKANSLERAKSLAEQYMKAIASGIVAPIRVFSDVPFYAGQTKDINPSTGVELDRYSKVALCPANDAVARHRQFIVAKTTVANTESLPA